MEQRKTNNSRNEEKNRLLLSYEMYQKQEFYFEILLDANRHPLKVYCENLKKRTMVGNIYIAKVAKIMVNLHAAFLDLGDGKKAFLPLQKTDSYLFTKKNAKKETLCQGDELMIQIVNDPIKTKDATASAFITLKSAHLILKNRGHHNGVSKKIEDGQRTVLKAMLAKESWEDISITVRTNAVEIPQEILYKEMQDLVLQYRTLLENSKHQRCFTLLAEHEPHFIETILHAKPTEFSEIITDQKEIYASISKLKEQDFCQKLQELSLLFYDDREYSLFKLYNLETFFDRITQPKAYMKSGAYLVIEQTEALTVIDVNSGKKVEKKETEDEFFRINQEAVAEIARQIRLRNISGIIIIDFINLKKDTLRQELIQYFRELVKEDPCHVQILDFTKLDLLELTREKRYPSLKQMLL